MAFSKPAKVVAAPLGKLAKSGEYNNNLAFALFNFLVGMDSDGNYSDFDIGNLAIKSLGAFCKDLHVRATNSIKTYNASGVLQESKTWQQLIEDILPTRQVVSIASGIIPSTHNHIHLKGEGDVADTLTKITCSDVGKIMYIYGPNAYDITFAYSSANLQLEQVIDFKLVDGDFVVLICVATDKFVEICRHSTNSFKTLTGYYYLPNDILVQYGVDNLGWGATKTFPIAFDSIESIQATPYSSSRHSTSVGTLTTTNFKTYSSDTSDGAAVTINVHWVAIGKKAQ